jgi:pyruvate/2-oxoglutarate/acetoin dehydrogenase E1 component
LRDLQLWQRRADEPARRAQIEAKHGWKVRVVDLRWLVPLNHKAIARHARECKRILVVDEGRFSAGIGEGVITAITEAGLGGKPGRRVWSAPIPTRRWRALRSW